jgi:hypothetical protein
LLKRIATIARRKPTRLSSRSLKAAGSSGFFAERITNAISAIAIRKVCSLSNRRLQCRIKYTAAGTSLSRAGASSMRRDSTSRSEVADFVRNHAQGHISNKTIASITPLTPSVYLVTLHDP